MVVVWLCICATLVFAMVLLGGAVRLTGSGLSMVDWKPLMGFLPPVSEIAWTQVFTQYQQYPEYKLVNTQMNLEQFKFIYLMEYSHRNLGRLIGLAFFLPFIYFLVSRRLSASLIPKLWILFALGAVQGGIGWYMVKSGLVDNPRVSQYRLVIHLVTAVIIYAYMIRVLVGLLPGLHIAWTGVRSFGLVVLSIILIMIASGGFVAGTHAGFIYNTFPTMGGQWVPPQLDALSPLWRNFFENAVTIQFTHRVLALVVLVLVFIYGLILITRRRSDQDALVGTGLLIAVVLQVCLGIFTLVSGVPAVLGVAHQAGALILLTVTVISVSSALPVLCEE
jgi:cytochrome c oxidase assembly protein subunit 15